MVHIIETQITLHQWIFTVQWFEFDWNVRSIMFNYYNSIKTDYLFRSPKGKWLFIVNLGIFIQNAIGFSVLDPKFEVWWFSYAAGVVFLDIICSFFYTLWFYWETPLKGLLFIALLGIVIPVWLFVRCTVSYLRNHLLLPIFY